MTKFNKLILMFFAQNSLESYWILSTGDWNFYDNFFINFSRHYDGKKSNFYEYVDNELKKTVYVQNYESHDNSELLELTKLKNPIKGEKKDFNFNYFNFGMGYFIFIDSLLFHKVNFSFQIELYNFNGIRAFDRNGIHGMIEAFKSLKILKNFNINFSYGIIWFDLLNSDDYDDGIYIYDYFNDYSKINNERKKQIFKFNRGKKFFFGLSHKYFSVKYAFCLDWGKILGYAGTITLISTAYSIFSSIYENAKANYLDPVKISKTKFKDVGGHHVAKKEFKEIVNFISDSKKFKDRDAKLPRGILLYGPPGTGKTLLGKAIGGESGCTFLYVTAADITDITRLQQIFAQTKTSENKSCILFIDEIEMLGSRQDSLNRYMHILTKLLTIIDGFEGLENVFILAATNNIEKIDPALLREGRLGKKIYIGLPKLNERIEIIKLKLENKKIDKDLDIEKIAELLQSFSGADIEGIINQSMINAINDNCDCISYKHFEKALDQKLLGEKNVKIVHSDEDMNLIAEKEAAKVLVYQKLCKNILNIYKSTILTYDEKVGQTTYIIKENKNIFDKEDYINLIKAQLASRAIIEALNKSNIKINDSSLVEFKDVNKMIIELKEKFENKYYDKNNKNFINEVNSDLNIYYNEVLEFLKRHLGEFNKIKQALLGKKTLTLNDIEDLNIFSSSEKLTIINNKKI